MVNKGFVKNCITVQANMECRNALPHVNMYTLIIMTRQVQTSVANKRILGWPQFNSFINS